MPPSWRSHLQRHSGSGANNLGFGCGAGAAAHCGWALRRVSCGVPYLSEDPGGQARDPGDRRTIPPVSCGGKVAVCACAAQRAALWVISGPLRLEWPGPARMPGGLWARAAAQLACSWLERRLRAEPRVTFPLPERCYRRPPAACGGRPSGFGPPRSVSPGIAGPWAPSLDRTVGPIGQGDGGRAATLLGLAAGSARP